MKKHFLLINFIFCICIANAQPKLARELSQYYDAAWIDSTERLFSYDLAGRNSVIISNNLRGGFYPNTKEVRTFNSSNAVEIADLYSWNTATLNWNTSPHLSAVFTYNSSGKIERMEFGSGLIVDSFIYNTSGILSDYYSWMENGGTRTSFTWKSYTYNSSGLVSEMVLSVWLNSVWNTGPKTEYTYNSSGLLTEEKINEWYSSTWNYSNKIVYIYSGGELTEKQYISPAGSSTWKHTYSYNTDGTLAEDLMLNYDNGSWNNWARYLYFYTGTSSINTVNEQNINVYPNPSGGLFTVDFNFDETPAQMQVMDVTGKQVYNRHINSGSDAEINLTGLDKGIYLLHLTTAKGVETKKLIVK
ncbi:MAG TPA: T9SS type A sorting domain-containing protein [Bacteroidia bacterium]|nr:T9SS type A sorting domain-containing protein [Bacteroidia bacterium]